jgi:hypothetical protein
VTGRKQPRGTEGERDRAYRLFQKRGHGEVEDPTDDVGAVGEVVRERERWSREEGGAR